MYLVLLGTSHFGLDFLDFVHSRHDELSLVLMRIEDASSFEYVFLQ